MVVLFDPMQFVVSGGPVVKNGTNLNIDPHSYSTSLHIIGLSFLHHLGAVHCCPRRTDRRKDRLFITIVETPCETSVSQKNWLQWWLGHNARSAFTHLGLWRKFYDCSSHHFTASQCVLKCALLTFTSTSSRLVVIWKGNFRPRVWELGGRWICHWV